MFIRERWVLSQVTWPYERNGSATLLASLDKIRRFYPESEGWEFTAVSDTQVRIVAPSRAYLQQIVDEHVVKYDSQATTEEHEKRWRQVEDVMSHARPLHS